MALLSNSTNLLGLDSIRFEISFDSGMLSFDSSIAASGWTLHDSELSQGNWEYTLTIDSANIQFPLTLALLHFTAYLSKDSVSDISLSSFEGTLNTNQFSGCSELSIQSGNSVTVIAEDTCGDKILRQFMQSGTVPLAIQSIVPNPASGVVGINFIAPTARRFPIRYLMSWERFARRALRPIMRLLWMCIRWRMAYTICGRGML